MFRGNLKIIVPPAEEEKDLDEGAPAQGNTSEAQHNAVYFPKPIVVEEEKKQEANNCLVQANDVDTPLR